MTMPSLQPPTDNLYKFMAILGLLLFVGGTIYPWTKAYELEIRVIELTAEVNLARVDQTKVDVIQIEKKADQIRLTFRAVIGLFVFGIFSMATGGWLMYRGFCWWYQRVQVPLDQELLLRASMTKQS